MRQSGYLKKQKQRDNVFKQASADTERQFMVHGGHDVSGPQ